MTHGTVSQQEPFTEMSSTNSRKIMAIF